MNSIKRVISIPSFLWTFVNIHMYLHMYLHIFKNLSILGNALSLYTREMRLYMHVYICNFI